jgi:hypothetical protein
MEIIKGNAIGHSRKVMALSKGICQKPVPELKTWARRIFNIAESNTSAKGWQLSIPAEMLLGG